MYVVAMLFSEPSLIDEFTAELAETTKQVARLQARQLTIINQLQRAGVANQAGSRTMIEWTAVAMDISHRSAQQMVTAANQVYRQDPMLFEDMEAGDVTLDRAVATLGLMGADAPSRVVDHSFNMDLSAVARLTHQYRRIRRKDEHRAFTDRHFVIQPSLDQSHCRGWFELPGIDGRTVEDAITRRADEVKALPGGDYFSRPQRQADALVAMAQDTLDQSHEHTASASGSDIIVFVDADRAATSENESGVEIQYGPRVGPNTLEELVCGASVQLVGLQDGRPVITSDNTEIIPPAVRSFVAWRDAGCSVAGCTNRYRLQPHHIKHRHHNGDHDLDNLATLCWFHHHIAIHRAGFTLEPDDPPGCRRLKRPKRGHDPPG